MMYKRIALLSILFALIAVSCNKEEGIGGKATIKGRIYVQEYSGGILVNEDYGPDVDVFIIYGEGKTFYDDNVKTSYDGSYEFRFLRPGIYKIFAYSKHPNTGELSAVIRSVEISNKKEIVTVEDITVKS